MWFRASPIRTKNMTTKGLPDRANGSRRKLAASVGEDLRALVVILTSLFEREISDGEALVHIMNAKSAAERGLVLSERLADMSAEGDAAGERKAH